MGCSKMSPGDLASWLRAPHSPVKDVSGRICGAQGLKRNGRSSVTETIPTSSAPSDPGPRSFQGSLPLEQ